MRVFDGFQQLYEDFRRDKTNLSRNAVTSDDAQSCIEALSMMAQMAVEDGVSVDDAHYIRNSMESLKLVLSEDMYNQYVPESLFHDLNAIIGDSRAEENKVEGLDFPLYLNGLGL